MANIAFVDAFLLYLQNPRNANGNLGVQGLFVDTVTDNITAHAGGGAAGAVALPSQSNRITVCATIGDSVSLPQSVAGARITVVNDGATAAQVFGIGGDLINGVAGTTGLAQAAATEVEYRCFTAGSWIARALSV